VHEDLKSARRSGVNHQTASQPRAGNRRY
jgi:hypothetical protein